MCVCVLKRDPTVQQADVTAKSSPTGCDVSSNQTAVFSTRHSRRSYTGTKITNRQESSSTGRSATEFRAEVTEMTEILLTISLWGVQRTIIMSEKHTDVPVQSTRDRGFLFLSLGTRKQQSISRKQIVF